MNEQIQTLIDNDDTIHLTDAPLFKFLDDKIVSGKSFYGNIYTVNTERLDKDDPLGNLIEYLTHNRHTIIRKIGDDFIYKTGDNYYASVTMIKDN